MAFEVLNDPGRTDRIAAARECFLGDAVDMFVEGMFRTDQLVDTVAEELAERGRAGWQALDQVLSSGRSMADVAPATLGPLLDPLMSPPSWFDAEQVRWGAALWWRFWLSNQIGLGWQSAHRIQVW